MGGSRYKFTFILSKKMRFLMPYSLVTTLLFLFIRFCEFVSIHSSTLNFCDFMGLNSIIVSEQIFSST